MFLIKLFLVRQLTLQLAEAESNLSEKQKLVDLAHIEVKELRGRDKDSFEKYEKAVREMEKLKTEIVRLKAIERDYNDKKVGFLNQLLHIYNNFLICRFLVNFCYKVIELHFQNTKAGTNLLRNNLKL